MGRRVIVTRSEPGAGDTADRLAALGFMPVLAPMLSLQATGERVPDLGGAQGLVFTSANGVRFFCDQSDRRDFAAWCVGPATFEAARRAGFADCRNADGDGAGLADHVAALCDPAAGPLVHVANAAARGDVAARLRAAGFGIVFAPLYAATPARDLPGPARAALSGQEPCIVLIHSAKGAAAFAGLAGGIALARHGLAAISPAAAKPLDGRAFAAAAIARTPNETALVAALAGLDATL